MPKQILQYLDYEIHRTRFRIRYESTSAKQENMKEPTDKVTKPAWIVEMALKQYKSHRHIFYESA